MTVRLLLAWCVLLCVPAVVAQTGCSAVSYFVNQGWSFDQACGLVGNLLVESNLSPTATGDKGAAYGIAQWHPDRQATCASFLGVSSMRGTSVSQQLTCVQHELENAEKGAAKKIRTATSAGQAAALVDQYYERSSGAARQERITKAEGLTRSCAGGGGGGGVAASKSGSTGSSSTGSGSGSGSGSRASGSSGGGAYDVEKAIAYADANCQEGKPGLCAEFVSRSLHAGGLLPGASFDPSNYQGQNLRLVSVLVPYLLANGWTAGPVGNFGCARGNVIVYGDSPSPMKHVSLALGGDKLDQHNPNRCGTGSKWSTASLPVNRCLSYAGGAASAPAPAPRKPPQPKKTQPPVKAADAVAKKHGYHKIKCERKKGKSLRPECRQPSDGNGDGYTGADILCKALEYLNLPSWCGKRR